MVDIDLVVGEFKAGVQKIYGERLRKTILYGSWARREARADSDIDIVVVLAGNVIPGKEIDRMVNLITDLNLKNNVLISIYPVSERNYLGLNSPLLMNVRREGVVT